MRTYYSLTPVTLLALMTGSCAAYSQNPQANSGQTGELLISNIAGVFVPPLPHAPFSGTVQITSKQTLNDGSVNELRTIEHIARDADGRTYTERRRLVAKSFEEEPPMVTSQIYDPTTSVLSQLDPYTLIDRQTTNASPPMAPRRSVPASDPAAQPASFRREDLGSQMMLGLNVKGLRQSDADTSDEFWYSPELSLYLLRKTERPHLHETIEVVQIDRGEPTATLFVVPANYKKIEDPGLKEPAQADANGIYTLGRGVTAPRLTYSVDPEYTNAARAAKLGGICVLTVIVDTKGLPRDVYVARSLDPGLDKKAIEAVKQYRFKPAMFEGHPVAVKVNVEVNFRIY